MVFQLWPPVPFNPDVEIVKETYKGKELLVIDDDEAPFVRQGQFRLMDLPAELRVHIYEYLLPCNKVLRFQRQPHSNWRRRDSAIVHESITQAPTWNVVVANPNKPDARGLNNQYLQINNHRNIYINNIQTQLFLVSKTVSAEAKGTSLPVFHSSPATNLALSPKAILYNTNTYEFTLTNTPHLPTSLKSPEIFGPLGEPHRLHLLRNLRRIHIATRPMDRSHWGLRRMRARLAFFIAELNAHAADASKRSLLQWFSIEMSTPWGSGYVFPSIWHSQESVDKFKRENAFGLEELVALRGVENVEVTGVPGWFAQCLELCVKGEGGELREIEWPSVRVKRQRGEGGGTKVMQQTLKQWWQPVFDWKEFAERNGVEVPDEADSYWPSEA
jgi:hypothetical protein